MSDVHSLAQRIRVRALKMVFKAGSSHIGSMFSIADILAVLYSDVLCIDPAKPNWLERDRFLMSKGHAGAILYAVLAERGFFPLNWLDTYYQTGSILEGHVSGRVPGVELSTGSLGHGLPIGCGMALAAKRDQKDYRIFVLLSDGELDEGSNWEAILFAPQHKLDNLVVIIDHNRLQGFGNVDSIIDLTPLRDKWSAFRWGVCEVDGHVPEEIRAALTKMPVESGRPSVVIAHTIKGKGVSFMENQLSWHYKSPDEEQFRQALDELGGDV
jgi:transketolase